MSYETLARLQALCLDANGNGKSEVWVAINTADPSKFDGPFDTLQAAQNAAAGFGLPGRAWGPFCSTPPARGGGAAALAAGVFVCVHLPGSTRTCQRTVDAAAGDVAAYLNHFGLPALDLATLGAGLAAGDYREFAASIIRALFFNPDVPDAVIENRYAVIVELVNRLLTSPKQPDSIFLTAAATKLLLLPHYVATGNHAEAKLLRDDLGLP